MKEHAARWSRAWTPDVADAMLVDSPTSAGLDQPSCDHSIEPSNNHAQHNERARDNAHALTFSAIEGVIEVGVDDSAAVVRSAAVLEASFL